MKKLKGLTWLLFFGIVGLSGLIRAWEYDMPTNGEDIIGENYEIGVKKGESLTTIRHAHGVSYDELLMANPNINFYKLREGQKILIPKQFVLPKFREGVVVNIPELRIYFFTPDGKKVYTFPVGLGRENWRTPLASTKVMRKKADPYWHVPTRIREYTYQKTGKMLPDVVGPGAKNPLGRYALYLGIDGYLIHGTNAPNSVGTFISSGCVRMLREPIELLYQKVKVGTPVHIIHYPIKAGWKENNLYLEVHESINTYEEKPESELNNSDYHDAIYEAVRMKSAKIFKEAVVRVLKEKRGIPTIIGRWVRA